MADLPPIMLKTGARLCGFLVTRVTAMPALRAVVYELEHEASGAKILHVHADDAENLVCVTFRTPPTNDTGLPHIMEHSVLGGSQKYRVKDPFFEMVKSSMATFINAMTGGDQTLYPVASNVKADFYNLAEVYFDAVFHPNLTELTFKREGHHLEFAEAGNVQSPLTIQGIVYNEMKGVYSSPESLLWDGTQKRLFPDSPYGKDAGGDPERIPDLTYADFRRFHAEHYRPDNALFFFYGDIPTAEHLAFLEERLRGYARRGPVPEIKPQARWTAPRIAQDRYPVAAADEVKAKTYIVMSWLVGRITAAEEVMAMRALATILLGHQGAPLRKAIVDSRLGEDLVLSMYNPGGLDTTFHVGIKGSEPERREALEKLIGAALREIAATGITAERVEAALQQLAYQFLEIQSQYPLHVLDRVMTAWLYGEDALTYLRAGELLEGLRRRYAQDPAIFGRLIREKLLDNPHRLTFVLAPDRELAARKDAAQAQRMQNLKGKMGPADLDKVAAEAAELTRLANTPNAPEALAALPRLAVRDLPRKPKHIPTTVENLSSGVEFLRNEVFANGVSYLHLDFDLAGLDEALWPYVPLYADCIRKMGAAGKNYVQMAERVASCTGGIGFGAYLTSTATPDAAPLQRGRFTLKALERQMEKALDVLGDFLFAVDPTDTARLTEVVGQLKAWHLSQVANHGMSIAQARAGRGLSAQLSLGEIIGTGVPQLRLAKGLADGFAGRQAEVVEKLLAIRRFLLNRRGLVVSFTGSDAAHRLVRARLDEWTARLRNETAPVRVAAFKRGPVRDGLAGPMDVAYCVTVLPAPHEAHADAPLLALGARFVSQEYVLEEVRFKGTAYGGSCGYDGLSGIWGFSSYRDPWITRTLQVYADAAAWVRKRAWTQEELDRAIIGTAKDGERPIRPEAATGTALSRHLTRTTRDIRERRQEAILSAAPAAVQRAVLAVLEPGLAQAGTCVVSSREKLEAANRQLGAAGLRLEGMEG